MLLEMEGFGAFRDATRVDFADADLFALQGPTGAGKSTVIDAICFALYGNVPRYDDQRLVGAAMSSNAAEMRVRLRFEVAGKLYDAVRVVRRTSSNAPGLTRVSTREARLEIVDGPVIAGKEGELRTAVEELLGLTFDDFTRCVVLPQGAFARFLHDKPADRQALLVRLLDLGIYGRMVQRANTRASDLDREIAFVDGRLDGLIEASPDALADVVGALARVRSAEVLLSRQAPVVGEATAAVEQATQALTEQNRWLGALSEVAVPAGVSELADRFGVARAAIDTAESGHADALTALDATTAQLADGPSAALIHHQLQVHERLAKGREVIARLAEERVGHEQRVTATAAIAESAQAVLEDARHSLERLRKSHLAHTLAVELRPGEPCPVCEQMVSTLPLPVTPAGLRDAEQSVAIAERDADRSRREADAAGQQLMVLADRQARAEELRAELSVELESTPSAEALREVARRRDELEMRAADARRQEQAAREKVAETRHELEKLDRDQQRVASRMHAQRDALVPLGAPAPEGSLVEAWAALAAWASVQRPEIEASIRRLTAQRETAEQRVRSALGALVDLVQTAGVGDPATSTVKHLRRAIDRETHALSERETMIRASIELRAGLGERRQELNERRGVAAELGRLMKADRFQRWLVEETLVDLAAGGSGRLHEMSAGRYSLDLGAGGEFAVIDHAEGDERRGVRTLSGGETFQASLALALALSDHLVEMSGRRGHLLESIFLDEGFGTLDPESLDAVASTIEGLGSNGRMVGIVTHVAALAERMPVRFVVSRGARSAVVERLSS